MKRMKVYLSVVVFSALLPVILWGVVGGPTNKLVSKAENADELTIWFEPAEIKMKSGEYAKISIIARYGNPNGMIPQLKANINVSEDAEIEPKEIDYDSPFNGETKVEEITVRFSRPGRYEIKVLKEGIYTGMANLDAKTYPALAIVEP